MVKAFENVFVVLLKMDNKILTLRQARAFSRLSVVSWMSEPSGISDY